MEREGYGYSICMTDNQPKLEKTLVNATKELAKLMIDKSSKFKEYFAIISK